MNEQEWLTCTESHSMMRHLRSIHNGHPLTTKYDNYVKFGSEWNSPDCDEIRCNVGNPFRPIITHFDWPSPIEPVRYRTGILEQMPLPWYRDTLAWRDGTIPKLAQKCHDGDECKKCDGVGKQLKATYGPPEFEYCCGRRMRKRDGYGVIDGQLPMWCSVCWALFLPKHTGHEEIGSCLECNRSGRVNRYDSVSMAILADALEEAGCNEEALLLHLRKHEKPCDKCNGMGSNIVELTMSKTIELAKATHFILPPGARPSAALVRCESCNGKGRIAVNHYPGCHAVAMFLPNHPSTATPP